VGEKGYSAWPNTLSLPHLHFKYRHFELRSGEKTFLIRIWQSRINSFWLLQYENCSV